MPESLTDSIAEEKRTSAGRKKVSWSKKKILAVTIFVLIVIISIAVLVLTFIYETFIFTIVKDYFILPLLEIGFWAYIVFLGIMILQSLIVPIPSELILLSGGMIFGLWRGVIIGTVGSLLSGLVTYYLSNKGGRPILEATGEYVGFADRFILVMDIWIEKWGIWAIIVGRAVPIIMFDPVSYAAGLSNLKWKQYTLATFIGSIPRAIFYAFFGVQLLAGHSPDYIASLSPEQFEAVAGQFNLIFYIIFGVLVIMLALASFLSKRMTKESEKNKIQEKES